MTATKTPSKKFVIGLDIEPRGTGKFIFRCEMDVHGCQEYFSSDEFHPECPNCQQTESVFATGEETT